MNLVTKGRGLIFGDVINGKPPLIPPYLLWPLLISPPPLLLAASHVRPALKSQLRWYRSRSH